MTLYPTISVSSVNLGILNTAIEPLRLLSRYVSLPEYSYPYASR